MSALVFSQLLYLLLFWAEALAPPGPLCAQPDVARLQQAILARDADGALMHRYDKAYIKVKEDKGGRDSRSRSRSRSRRRSRTRSRCFLHPFIHDQINQNDGSTCMLLSIHDICGHKGP